MTRRREQTPTILRAPPLLVVSDLHLRGPGDPNQARFLKFLDQRVRPAADVTLLVAGDLFDFWYGVPGAEPAHVGPVLAALRSLPDVLWLEGNHDVLIERVLRGEQGLEIHAGPIELHIAGKRLHVAHGDRVDPTEIAYRAFRALLRGPPGRIAARLLGSHLTHLAGSLGAGTSRAVQRVRGAEPRAAGRPGYDGANPRWLAAARRYAASRCDEGADLCLLGHGHQLGWWPEQLVCLGDWLRHDSYLEIDAGGVVSLRRFEADGSEDPVLATGPLGSLLG